MMELLCNDIGLFILESKKPFLMALIFIYSAKLYCMYAIFLRSLIYFKNTGKGFSQMTIPVNHLGRWSVMDIADIEGDGDLDVVLGSHAVAKFPAGGFDPAWKTAKGILILRNKKR